MDKRCRICWGLLILFLLLNIVFIGIWINRTNVTPNQILEGNQLGEKGIKHQQKYRNYLVKKLNLDSLQAKMYNDLKCKHVEEMKETGKQVDSLRVLLGDEVFSENQDSARLAQLVKEITTQKMIFEWKNINHLKDVKSIMNEEQRVLFDELHKKMMSKMKHGGGSPYRGEGRRKKDVSSSE